MTSAAPSVTPTRAARLPWLLDDAAPLAAAVAAAGGRLRAARPTDVRHEPGRRTVVRYRTDVAWPAADGAGETERVESYVLAAGQLPAGAAQLQAGDGTRLAVWAYPADPHLPGLASASSPAAVARVLGHADGDASLRLTPRVYRPLRRGVIEATAATRRCFLKVVAPDEAPRLHAVHRALADRAPVPRALGLAAAQGIVALQARSGQTLGTVLAGDHGGQPPPVPSPQAVLAPLADLARAGGDAPLCRPESPGHRAGRHAELLAAIVPGTAAAARGVAARADAVAWSPDRVVHGDFYEAQVLVAGGRVTALLDVDALRPGDGLDDLATLLAHLEVLAWMHPVAAGRIAAFGAGAADLARRRAPAHAVARRVAGELLGLAGWPFRAQHDGWPDAVAELVGCAERISADERLLMGGSRASQPPRTP